MAAESIRDRLVAAAFTLFEERGFAATSVDDIAAHAHVGRTTLFRHFRSKEALVFPDHDVLLARADDTLSGTDGPGMRTAVIGVATDVFEHYLSEGDLARSRYRLTRSVPALKDYEVSTVSQYVRMFAKHLKSTERPGWEAELGAELSANAIVTAHNFVLRRWLREECVEPRTELAQALAKATATAETGARLHTAVIAFSTTDPLESVVPRLREVLEAPTPDDGDQGRRGVQLAKP